MIYIKFKFKMKKHGKRKLNDLKKNAKKKQMYEYVNPKKKNNENENKNEHEYSYPKKNKKKLLNDKLLKQNPHDSIIATSKESCGFIEKILTQNDNDNKENNDNNAEKEIDINKDVNQEKKTDNFLINNIYELFEGYDEIIIKPNSNNQYIINASIKLEDNAEIKFEIIYDHERDYFDYYSNNKNFRFENEDEPFNYDLDIPKEDFPLLIKNFKKFKFKH